jgi:Tfp pilus tip-associated adhesin PilY1
MANGFMTFAEVQDSDLKDVSGATVYSDGSLSGLGTTVTTNAASIDIRENFMGYKRKLTAASDLGSGVSRYEMILTQPKVTSIGNGGSLMTFTSFEPSQASCGDFGTGYLYLVDTYTGLPNPSTYSSFVTAGTPPLQPGVPGVVTGVIELGDGKSTEASIIQTNVSLIFTGSSADGSTGTIQGPSGLNDDGEGGGGFQSPTESSGVTSWREVMNMGYQISPENMTRDLD